MYGYAPVAPTNILAELKKQNALGEYHLLLAHDVLAHPKEYADIFDGYESPNQSFQLVKIMDNSVTELGTAVDFKTTLEAVKTVHANVIVLPDVYLNAAATVESIREALPKWTEECNKLEWPWSFMIIPQGKSQEEFAWCAEQLNLLWMETGGPDSSIGWWGIPRNYNQNCGSRCDAVTIARMINSELKMHLLGFSDNIVDDMLAVRMPYVRGIDSAVPVRAASQCNMSMSLYMPTLPKRGDWWDNAEWNDLIIPNVKQITQYMTRR